MYIGEVEGEVVVGNSEGNGNVDSENKGKD